MTVLSLAMISIVGCFYLCLPSHSPVLSIDSKIVQQSSNSWLFVGAIAASTESKTDSRSPYPLIIDSSSSHYANLWHKSENKKVATHSHSHHLSKREYQYHLHQQQIYQSSKVVSVIPQQQQHSQPSHHHHYQKQQQQYSNDGGGGPYSGSMNNVTVSVGRNATFECIFLDLKKDFRLAWFHRSTLLALHDTVIIKNGRVSVRSHANTTFYLTIHDIREDDRGRYMCQVNTVPMQLQIGYLEVNVPPKFIEQLTSSDMDVNEHSSVSLQCAARGQPVPQIRWRREDGGPLYTTTTTTTTEQSNLPNSSSFSLPLPSSSLHHNNRANIPSVIEGNYLNISKVTRAHMGAYLCIASNGIPSPVSKRIFLGVSFAPMIRNNRENKSIGVYVGSSVALECNVESYPQPNVYWIKDDQMPPIIHSDKKYEISLNDGNTSYRFVLRLKIIDLHQSDMGKYTCVAKNALGEAKASVKLHEIERKVRAKPAQVNLAGSSINSGAKMKNIFFGFFTTTKPTSEATSSRARNNKFDASIDVDTYSINREEDRESLDYETNYISPEMTSDGNHNNNQNSANAINVVMMGSIWSNFTRSLLLLLLSVLYTI